MPNFNNPIFVKPKDPSVSEQIEQMSAVINEQKKDLEEAEFVLKHVKLSEEDRLDLEATVAIAKAQLAQDETRFRDITAQYKMQKNR